MVFTFELNRVKLESQYTVYTLLGDMMILLLIMKAIKLHSKG